MRRGLPKIEPQHRAGPKGLDDLALQRKTNEPQRIAPPPTAQFKKITGNEVQGKVADQIDREAKTEALKLCKQSGFDWHHFRQLLRTTSTWYLRQVLTHLPYDVMRYVVKTSRLAKGDNSKKVFPKDIPLEFQKEFPTEARWTTLLTGDVIQSSVLRSWYKSRSSWLKSFFGAENYPEHSCLPVFAPGNLQSLPIFTQRILREEFPEHPTCKINSKMMSWSHFKEVLTLKEEIHWDKMAKENSSVKTVIQNLSLFQHCLDVYTKGVLSKVSWNNVFLGGSAVLASVLPIPEEIHRKYLYYREYLKAIAAIPLPKEVLQIIERFARTGNDPFSKFREALNNYYNNLSHVFYNGDIDLFITCDNSNKKNNNQSVEHVDDEHVESDGARISWKNSAERLYNEILKSLPESREICVIKTKHSISICPGYPYRNIQIITSMYRHYEEHILFSDLDCASAVYDGSNVWVAPRTVRSWNFRANFIEPAALERPQTNLGRIRKYAKRGFCGVAFELCKHSPRCDVSLSPTQEKILRRITETSSGRRTGFKYSVYNIRSSPNRGIPDGDGDYDELEDIQYNRRMTVASIRGTIASKLRAWDLNNGRESARKLGLRDKMMVDEVVDNFEENISKNKSKGVVIEDFDKEVKEGGEKDVAKENIGEKDTVMSEEEKAPCFDAPKNDNNPWISFEDVAEDEFPKKEFPSSTVRPPFVLGKSFADVFSTHDLSFLTWKFETMANILAPKAPKEPTCYMCGLKISQDSIAKIPRNSFYKEIFQENISKNRIGLCLCKNCDKVNTMHQNASTDMSGKICLVTGARIKIGYHVALRFLRFGATVVAITRFPKDAARKFLSEKDFSSFASRLHIYGLDLRHFPSIQQFLQHFRQNYSRLDVLINNAAQTIRRPPAYYRDLAEGEMKDSDMNKIGVLIKEFGKNPWEIPKSNQGNNKKNNNSNTATSNSNSMSIALNSAGISLSIPPTLPLSFALPLIPLLPSDYLTSKEIAQNFPKDRKDESGDQLDLRRNSTWNSTIEDVSAIEVLEVQMVNSIVPSLLISQLLPLMISAANNVTSKNRDNKFGAKGVYVVNVSSSEGQFNAPKTGEHVHTNMAKASLNMLTHTLAYLSDYNVHVTSVDTGWVSRMRPWNSTMFDSNSGKIEGNSKWKSIVPPLSSEDGATRVTHPVLCGMSGGTKFSGVLLKDFNIVPW